MRSDEAAQRIGLAIPDDWFGETGLARLRLDDLRADPAYQEWSLRAIGERETRRMVGHIGFHTRPGAEYLLAWAPAGVEVGFTVYPPFQRLGYAREAVTGLIRWAHRQRNVCRFVVSIAPGNSPSMALARGLGFITAGSWQDEVDGIETVLILEGDPLRKLLDKGG